MDLAVSENHMVKMKEKVRQIPGSCQRSVQPVEQESNGNTNCELGKEPCRSNEESRQSKLHHYWDHLEYDEESWRPEETYCKLDFNKKKKHQWELMWKTRNE